MGADRGHGWTTLSGEARQIRQVAFQRGAEAMREAAYQAAYRNLIDGDDDVCADTCRAIRTLRIPEDK
jgi:hypothetical protein